MFSSKFCQVFSDYTNLLANPCGFNSQNQFFKDLFNQQFCERSTIEFLRDQQTAKIICEIFHPFIVADIKTIQSQLIQQTDSTKLENKNKNIKIVLTNFMLKNFAGSELWTLDVAMWLRRMGVSVLVYAPGLGPVTEHANGFQISITSSIQEVVQFNPDIVHVNHFNAVKGLLNALDSRCKIVNMIHGLLPRPGMPGFTSVHRYCAVSIIAKAKVHVLTSTPWEQIHQIPNFFDENRFIHMRNCMRKSRALLYSSRTSKIYGEILRQTVNVLGMTLDHVGYGAIPTTMPENLLANYDLVFAVGRSAIEALACGCQVILWDNGIIGPVITQENFWTAVIANFALTTKLLPFAFIDEVDATTWVVKQLEVEEQSLTSVTLLTRSYLSASNVLPLLLDLYADTIN